MIRHNGFSIDDDGLIIGTTNAPAPEDVWIGGLRYSSQDGAVRMGLTPPSGHVNGWPVAVDGILCYQGADPTHVENGIPIAASGAVAVQQFELPDHVQNGFPFKGERLAFVIRAIGILHPIAFSNGFTNGFF